MTKDDKLIDSMVDEVIETSINPDGKVERRWITDAETLADMEREKEMADAVAEFVQRSREFLNTLDAQTDPERRGILWWRACEWMMLADRRMKEAFCGRDRSPRSIAQYHRFRLKMMLGQRYRTDA